MGIMDSIKGAMDGDNKNEHVDKARDLANQHEDKIDSGVERAGDMIDDKTGNRFEGQVDKGQDFIQDKTGNL